MQNSEVPLYSLKSLEEMAAGDTVFIKRLVDLFVTQIPEAAEEIRTAYAAGDFEKLRKTAHRIKPSLDNLEVVLLRDEIREIEKKAELYGHSERLSYLVNNLSIVVDAVVAQLREAYQ